MQEAKNDAGGDDDGGGQRLNRAKWWHACASEKPLVLLNLWNRALIKN